MVFSFFHISSCLPCLPASLHLLSFFLIHSISFSFYLYVYVCVGIGRYGGPPPLQVGMSSISTMSVTTCCAYCVTQHGCPDVSRETTALAHTHLRMRTPCLSRARLHRPTPLPASWHSRLTLPSAHSHAPWPPRHPYPMHG